MCFVLLSFVAFSCACECEQSKQSKPKNVQTKKFAKFANFELASRKQTPRANSPLFGSDLFVCCFIKLDINFAISFAFLSVFVFQFESFCFVLCSNWNLNSLYFCFVFVFAFATSKRVCFDERMIEALFVLSRDKQTAFASRERGFVFESRELRNCRRKLDSIAPLHCFFAFRCSDERSSRN